MKFKVGNIIKGRPDNGYGVTGGDMYKGEVIQAFDNMMVIKILDHKYTNVIGEKFTVKNEDLAFELISPKKITKEELLKMPIGTKITTNFDKHNVFVKKSTDRFINDAAVIADYEIKEDLSIFDIGFGDEIIKVEVPTYETVYDNSEEVKEMTMGEICKALGYNVKIVKEEN